MQKKRGRKVTENTTIVYDNKVALNPDRVLAEMKSKEGTGKNKRFTLSDLAKEVNLQDGYFRRIYSKELQLEDAHKIADFFKVELSYLTGETDFRTLEDLLSTTEMRGREEFKKAIDYFSTFHKINIKPVSINSNGKICAPHFSINDIGLYEEDKFRYDVNKNSKGETIENRFAINYYDNVLEQYITKYIKVSDMISFIQKMRIVTENTFITFL